jgi:hypothetical protein
MGDLRRVYCRYCGQTFLSDDMEKCSACLKVGGILDPMEAAAVQHLVDQKQQEPQLPSANLPSPYAAFYALRLMLAGGFLIAVAISMLLVPQFRSYSQGLALTMIVLAVIIILIGAALIIFAVSCLASSGRPARKDERMAPDDAPLPAASEHTAAQEPARPGPADAITSEAKHVTDQTPGSP